MRNGIGAAAFPPEIQVRGVSRSATVGGGGTYGRGSKKASFMQRTAGRCLYWWAVQVGCRLQKFVEAEKERRLSEFKEDKKILKMMDDLEDFLDDGLHTVVFYT